MHENRLYIFEGTTPKGHPASALFQASVGFVNAAGNSLRYLDYYSNAIHGLRQYEPPPATETRARVRWSVPRAEAVPAEN